MPAGPTKLATFNAIGQPSTIKRTSVSIQVLMRARRLRWKRRQARWLGVEVGCSDAVCSSFITHSPIQKGMEQIHEQVQHDEQRGIKQREANRHGVIGIERTIDEV